MSCEEIVIDARTLSKRYEIYNTPRDRLKQLVLPQLLQIANRAGTVLGISKPKSPKSYYNEFWALHDISFQVKRGETLGIIGRNGSGKSTLLQILAGTLSPTSGEVKASGRIAALLELGSGFDPEFTGRENVFLNGRILGLSREEIETRYDQIVEFADIGEFIDQPVKTYSSGMFLRLAFAVQAHIDASIVIIDEALAVGDVFFRQKCYARLQQLRDSGAAILLVSHSMPDIEQYCERALLLDHGEVQFIGSSSEAAKHYYLLHQPRTIFTGESSPEKIPERSPHNKHSISIPDGAAIDISNRPQVSNGQAYCIELALCNEYGEPCNSFRQGDIAGFYCIFELNENIEVPLFGVLIINDRGVIVHGKNAWQYGSDVPTGLIAGDRIICRQKISLQLAPGEYTFEIGLASVTRSEWETRGLISHEEWSTRYSTVCVLTKAGQLSINYALDHGISVLTHHGIADLPGDIITEVIN